MCQKAERAGITWLSVHGRTVTQRRSPVDYQAIKIVRQRFSLEYVLI